MAYNINFSDLDKLVYVKNDVIDELSETYIPGSGIMRVCNPGIFNHNSGYITVYAFNNAVSESNSATTYKYDSVGTDGYIRNIVVVRGNDVVRYSGSKVVSNIMAEHINPIVENILNIEKTVGTIGTSDEDTLTHFVENIVPQLKKPIAWFEIDNQYGFINAIIKFIDKSCLMGLDSSTVYEWSFGDGMFSSEKNPSHIYTQGGVYDVTLTIKNLYGADSVTIRDAICILRDIPEDVAIVCDGLFSFSKDIVHYSAIPKKQEDNKTIVYNWSFGDGNENLSGESIKKIFYVGGIFTPFLTQKTHCGNYNIQKCNDINIVEKMSLWTLEQSINSRSIYFGEYMKDAQSWKYPFVSYDVDCDWNGISDDSNGFLNSACICNNNVDDNMFYSIQKSKFISDYGKYDYRTRIVSHVGTMQRGEGWIGTRLNSLSSSSECSNSVYFLFGASSATGQTDGTILKYDIHTMSTSNVQIANDIEKTTGKVREDSLYFGDTVTLRCPKILSQSPEFHAYFVFKVEISNKKTGEIIDSIPYSSEKEKITESSQFWNLSYKIDNQLQKDDDVVLRDEWFVITDNSIDTKGGKTFIYNGVYINNSGSNAYKDNVIRSVVYVGNTKKTYFYMIKEVEKNGIWELEAKRSEVYCGNDAVSTNDISFSMYTRETGTYAFTYLRPADYTSHTLYSIVDTGNVWIGNERDNSNNFTIEVCEYMIYRVMLDGTDGLHYMYYKTTVDKIANRVVSITKSKSPSDFPWEATNDISVIDALTIVSSGSVWMMKMTYTPPSGCTLVSQPGDSVGTIKILSSRLAPKINVIKETIVYNNDMLWEEIPSDKKTNYVGTFKVLHEKPQNSHDMFNDSALSGCVRWRHANYGDSIYIIGKKANGKYSSMYQFIPSTRIWKSIISNGTYCDSLNVDECDMSGMSKGIYLFSNSRGVSFFMPNTSSWKSNLSDRFIYDTRTSSRDVTNSMALNSISHSNTDMKTNTTTFVSPCVGNNVFTYDETTSLTLFETFRPNQGYCRGGTCH